MRGGTRLRFAQVFVVLGCAACDSEPLAPSAADAAIEAGADDVRVRPDADGELHVVFNLPPEARSWLLVADPWPSVSRVRMRSLIGPDGELWYDEAAPDTGFVPLGSSGSLPPWPLSLMLPSDPARPVAPGRYEVTLWVEDPTAELTLELSWRRDDASDEVSLLPLRVWLPASGDRAAFEAALDGARQILADADIDVDLDAQSGETPSGALDHAMLHELLDQAEPRTEDAIDVVLLDSLSAAEGEAIGLTTGIPAPPPGADGASRGLVAIGLDRWPAAPERAAELLAHELCHALGLEHTSSPDGLRHDALADTPECPSGRAADYVGGRWLLQAADCDDRDGQNLMFAMPRSDDDPQRDLSLDQRELLRLSPWLGPREVGVLRVE